MKIVAMGTTPLDFEISCIGTLSKYAKHGHKVNLIIAGNKGLLKSKMDEIKERYQKAGISQIHLTEKFDYSKVTQPNVNVLRSIIEIINPSIAIIPFINTSNQKRRVLAHSSLLACRNVENVLMYETTRSRDFVPNVFYENTNFKRKRKSQHKLHSDDKAKSFEAFQSHRIVLLGNTQF